MGDSTTAVEPDWYAARRIAADAGPRLAIKTIPLIASVGRVLASDLMALGTVPSYPSSAMDGWAVAGPGPWRVDGQVLAGDRSVHHLEPGEAIAIATGGMLPEGSDGILRSEHGALEGETLSVLPGKPEPTGLHQRPGGEEATAGEVLAPAGTRLSPPLVGLAAATGNDTVRVFDRARVSTFLLGDELVRYGVARTGEVRDAIGPQLSGFIRLLGADAGEPVFVPDEFEATCAALRAATGDVVVTTGSTAHGPRDLLHDAIAEVGGRLVVDAVGMRPGHPALLAVLPDDRPLVGLPGNPLSAAVGLLTLLDPLLRGMAGSGLAPLRAEVSAARIAPRDLTRLAPVRRGPDGLTVTGWTGSGMLRGLAQADALAIVPTSGIDPGQPVETLPLPW